MSISYVTTRAENRRQLFRGSMKESFREAAREGNSFVLEISVRRESGGELSDIFQYAFIPVPSKEQGPDAFREYTASHLASDWVATVENYHFIEQFFSTPKAILRKVRESFANLCQPS